MKNYISNKIVWLLLLSTIVAAKINSQSNNNNDLAITPAAFRTSVYVPLLKHKRVAIFANQTSTLGNTHLVDTLLTLGVNIKKIFAPEHGFRGTADAGETVSNQTDTKTKLPIISLYGKKTSPSADDLRDVDIVIFDIQDVGVRFYTFISSLQYMMDACFSQHKSFLLLDRPNPNGFYIDGPVLDTNFRSFVGMQPVPVVYGMTMGEYAMMLAGENWLSPEANKVHDYYTRANNSVDTPFHFLIIKCLNYSHSSKYKLPVPPSPNLPNMISVYLYPSVCFFEGTAMSEGRGTDFPFQQIGHPSLPKNLYSFTPKPNAGAKSSKCYFQKCYGWRLAKTEQEALAVTNKKINLFWLKNSYVKFGDKNNFFLKNNFFNSLAGNNVFMEQIKKNISAEEIRKSWQKDIDEFKKIRKKYLLYEDF